MHKTIKKVFLNIVLILLVGILIGCSHDTKDTSDEPIESNTVQDSMEEDVTEQEESSVNEETESDNIAAEETTEADLLSPYSSQEIEYARIWLQLGPNQEIDELNVRHITTDEPINPNDETSISYPEDVIQLSGSRLVDGSITYRGNGDGTINVYNVPLRWDGQYPAGEAFYNDIVENTELEAIDVGDDEEVIELIKKIKLQ